MNALQVKQRGAGVTSGVIVTCLSMLIYLINNKDLINNKEKK